jgi:UDP-N-acetylmuramoyl-L-alanyl-D-glutamate--2,6-diaminopimelate ligase
MNGQFDPDQKIRKIQLDSRKVESGDLFIAQKGANSDGHRYIDQVIAQGAKAIVCEVLPKELHPDVNYIQVADTHLAGGLLASNFYGNPSGKINLIGVTGTNGKTTTATLLYQLFSELGYLCGLISTVSYKIGSESFLSTHTTPDAIRLNELLSEMVSQGCNYCFMEVSSHAIHQHRIAGLIFKGALFTNITHDHLDYHETFAEYIRVKKSWFDHLSSNAFSIINKDDKHGQVMVQNTASRIVTYSLKKSSDYKGKIIEMLPSGMQLQLNKIEVWTRLIGEFNAYNLLAVYACALELGADHLQCLAILSNLRSVDGRFETILSADGRIAIVDYAHTPDALKNVLLTIRDILNGQGRIISVFGAGGDRDRSKRPEMGKVVSGLSNLQIITSDNPRSENPYSILQEIKAGIPAEYLRNTLTIEDRREAIRTACQLANQGDIILIAGKGHETYQEIQGVKNHFDDKEEVKNIFNETQP